MKKNQLFEAIVLLWPEALGIKDYRPMGEGCFVTPALDDCYQQITAKIGTNNPWLDIGCWAFREALRERANINYANKVFFVNSSEVTLERFDELLRQNLADESWHEERVEYNKLNPE